MPNHTAPASTTTWTSTTLTAARHRAPDAYLSRASWKLWLTEKLAGDPQFDPGEWPKGDDPLDRLVLKLAPCYPNDGADLTDDSSFGEILGGTPGFEGGPWRAGAWLKAHSVCPHRLLHSAELSNREELKQLPRRERSARRAACPACTPSLPMNGEESRHHIDQLHILISRRCSCGNDLYDGAWRESTSPTRTAHRRAKVWAAQRGTHVRTPDDILLPELRSGAWDEITSPRRRFVLPEHVRPPVAHRPKWHGPHLGWQRLVNGEWLPPDHVFIELADIGWHPPQVVLTMARLAQLREERAEELAVEKKYGLRPLRITPPRPWYGSVPLYFSGDSDYWLWRRAIDCRSDTCNGWHLRKPASLQRTWEAWTWKSQLQERVATAKEIGHEIDQRAAKRRTHFTSAEMATFLGVSERHVTRLGVANKVHRVRLTEGIGNGRSEYRYSVRIGSDIDRRLQEAGKVRQNGQSGTIGVPAIEAAA